MMEKNHKQVWQDYWRLTVLEKNHRSVRGGLWLASTISPEHKQVRQGVVRGRQEWVCESEKITGKKQGKNSVRTKQARCGRKGGIQGQNCGNINRIFEEFCYSFLSLSNQFFPKLPLSFSEIIAKSKQTER